MKKITAKINGIEITVPQGTTILEAARKLNIHIPTLCHLDLHDLKAVNKTASCRVCVVEVEGRHNLMPSCAVELSEGMDVKTNTPDAIMARRNVIELMLSDHPTDCLVCEKNTKCELQSLASDLGIIGKIRYEGEMSTYKKDDSSKSMYRNPDKCIMCRRCETMCNEVQTCGILSATHRGFDAVVQPTFENDIVDTMCTFCGQCIAVCPTAALSEINDIGKVWRAIGDKSKHVVVQTAPAVRVALGEEFGMKPGTEVTGKMVNALRQLGFSKVYDTDFAADLTIVEEAHELVDRIKNGGRLPMLTSCCPAWVNFFEHQFQDLLDVPSTCKSPHQMFGAIAKSEYYAKKLNVNPEDVIVVSIMPCVAKKYESAREELATNAGKDVDYVITTRELATMIKEAGIAFDKLSDEDFDHPLGESTGAGVIFGSTGGVIEAALRTAYEWITGETLENVEFKQLRGFKGIRKATVNIGGTDYNIGVAHTLRHARTLLEAIRDGKEEFHAIEIMACPGGCIGGGGQPYHRGDAEIIKKRKQAIYKADKNKTRRKSHENESIKTLYKEFLGEIGGKKAHEILHTHYSPKEKL